MIEDSHHVTRLCWPRDFDGEEIRESAFEPTKKDKNRLSIDWVECTCVTVSQRTINASIDRLKKYVVKDNKTRYICLLNAGLIRNVNTVPPLDVVHDRSTNPCHGVIRPKNNQDSEIDVDAQEQLAEIANNNDIYRI